jgi:hypothetical protein
MYSFAVVIVRHHFLGVQVDIKREIQILCQCERKEENITSGGLEFYSGKYCLRKQIQGRKLPSYFTDLHLLQTHGAYRYQSYNESCRQKQHTVPSAAWLSQQTILRNTTP